MKMRRFFVVALATLGAAAAFTACQKDKEDKEAAKAPEIALFKTDNKTAIASKSEDVITEKEFIIRVKLADGVKLESLKWNFSYKAANGAVSSQFADGKEESLTTKTSSITKEEEVKFDKNLPAKEGEISFIAKDKNGKVTTLKRKVNLGGAAPAPAPAGTPMKNENLNAYVNHAMGTGAGAYSFSKKIAVREDGAKEDKEFKNLSKVKEEFKADFGSDAGVKFVKVTGKVDYDKATTEEVGKLAKEGTADKIEGLKENDLFVATKGEFLYLVKVTKIEVGKFDFADGSQSESKSEKGYGYMTFKYKSNK